MTVEEALLISASIARGQTNEAYSKHYDHLKEKVVKEVTYTITPTTEERQRSLDHILKVHGAYLDRSEITATVDINPLASLITHLKSDIEGDA